MSELLLMEGFLATTVTLALIFAYMALIQKDLVKAVVYSAVQSVAYAITFYLLMAPDLALVYVAIGVGIYPAVALFLIKKTERYEVA